ncbi:hypothetical protein RSAG8_10252, partial [Rhizoctonia solani AG-8 WAC10335]
MPFILAPSGQQSLSECVCLCRFGPSKQPPKPVHKAPRYQHLLFVADFTSSQYLNTPTNAIIRRVLCQS